MNDPKLTAEESCRQVLKTIADACDQESLARAGGCLFRYVREETVLRDCGQRGVCRTPPGCARHWLERNRELVRENEVLRSNSDHLSSENASLVSQVESMAMRIESLAAELAKPEDVRLREVLDALDGRAVIFDGLGARVGHLLDEMDEWIERAGAAERRLKKAEEVVLMARQLTADTRVRLAVARRPDLPARIVARLARDAYWYVRVAVAKRPALPRRLAARLARDADPNVRRAVALRPDLPARTVARLAGDAIWFVRDAVAGRPDLPARLLARLARDEDPDVRRAAAQRADLEPRLRAPGARDEEAPR